MKRAKWSDIRTAYEESTEDADGLAEAALDELKEGKRGDEDGPSVAIAYAILAVSRRIEAATDLLLYTLERANAERGDD